MTNEQALFAAIFAGVILFAGVKLGWGVVQWTERSRYRVGDRFGDEPASVTDWSDGRGYVSAGGEIWRAVSKEALKPGDEVIVAKVKGLTLDVKKR